MLFASVGTGILLMLLLKPRITYGTSSDDVTADVFGENNIDIFPVAIGDYDSDRILDTVLLSKNATSFQIYFGNATVPFLRPRAGFQCDLSSLGTTDVPARITGLALADFTGDGVLDILVTLKGNSEVLVRIFEGDTHHLNCQNSSIRLNGSNTYLRLKQEPLIMDWNGDMVADLFGEDESGRKLWIFNEKSEPLEFRCGNASTACLPIISPQSNAYADLDGDFSPELIIVSKDSGGRSHLETYAVTKISQNVPTFVRELDKVIRVGTLIPQRIGSLMFLDLSQSGKILPLIPFCRDKDCQHSGIMILENDEFKILSIKFSDSRNTTWGFLVPDVNTPYAETITLRFGDFDLDGFPDLIGTVATVGSSSRKSQAVVFLNVPCTHRECNYTRTYALNFDLLASYDNVVSAVFYDFYDNGLLDVMLVQKVIQKNNGSQTTNTSYKVQAVLNTPKYDGYFLKWMMTSGHCRRPHCPPYGAVLPGASMNYTMMNQKGFPQVGKSAQFFRSAYFPMDLPYVVIGTGSTPNFIDSVWIGRKASKESSESTQVQKWRQIIPNSHLVVIPYSKGWELKHFLSTNKEGAISTLQALLLILFINGAIVFLFWLKERKEDRRNVQMAGSLNFIRLS